MQGARCDPPVARRFPDTQTRGGAPGAAEGGAANTQVLTCCPVDTASHGGVEGHTQVGVLGTCCEDAGRACAGDLLAPRGRLLGAAVTKCPRT